MGLKINVRNFDFSCLGLPLRLLKAQKAFSYYLKTKSTNEKSICDPGYRMFHGSLQQQIRKERRNQRHYERYDGHYKQDDGYDQYDG
jgi:hypothetical protein